MSNVRHLNYNNDTGICQYQECGHPVPDRITMQLCAKHLRLAYAAYLIANPDQMP
ncbi:hypothetical protein SEA_ZUCKER_92 [Arthrobacter phage Zucker]|nr:hypothetical protein SEA_ZUCKER_92 [Arthrobacter phage Zucker]